MLVCWSWASVCGSPESAGLTLTTTGRSARSTLAGQEDPAERPAAELGFEPEAGIDRSDLGTSTWRRCRLPGRGRVRLLDRPEQLDPVGRRRGKVRRHRVAPAEQQRRRREPLGRSHDPRRRPRVIGRPPAVAIPYLGAYSVGSDFLAVLPPLPELLERDRRQGRRVPEHVGNARR